MNIIKKYVFVDFKQAYDNIIREKLWKIPTSLEIQTKIVNVIKLCNSNTKCVVKIQGEVSDFFETNQGVK